MENRLSADQLRALLAKYVRAGRKAVGMSQMELAEHPDLSAGFVNDLEGARKWVGAETLARLANELRVRPYQLLLEEADAATDLHAALAGISMEIKETLGPIIEEVVMRRAQPNPG